VDAPKAGQMIGGELGLDFRGDGRILHEYRGAAADRIGVIAGDSRSRPEQRAERDAGNC
jgi:hypothetical protein